MKEVDVRKLVKLQGEADKLRARIMQDVRRHNVLVTEQIMPMCKGILHNTIYEIDNTLYKRGKVICQLECEDYGLGIKAEGLAILRKINVESEKDAAPKNEKHRQGVDVAE
jgi:hypothetical protein